ncbi:lactate dehydrogenase [Anaerovorax odorimutans]|uniref:Lactate dehydrogenase n=1 Tax=Anaerovorax odorimutans TaxID=109327 RepID=A0ABT1RTJ9_9FIRM|nr:lactate dehydrogenase [Anaerovorax odorimutans]MCQ4638542.1 lactate dehydrogenase [Anaerovorax odorimutans]
MKRLSDLFEEPAIINIKQESFFIKPKKNPFPIKGKKRVNLLALGDVGSMLLIGLRLLGAEGIESIGICDLDPKVTARFEMEINQIDQPLDHSRLPEVEIISQQQLFDCDMMVFCASKGVPPVGGDVRDVRMAQLSANAQLSEHFARQAAESGFEGIFVVVSDPVDPLCKAAYSAGLRREQVQGYGLGVMNARALYFARRDERFASFLTEGRAFGPHGEDLVIANSLENYDDGISKELTRLAAESNMKTRELGFKPFIAPALSSGAISLLATLSGQWNYSSVYFGRGGRGAFLGVKNRRTPYGIEVENLPLPEELFSRIEYAYERLRELL